MPALVTEIRAMLDLSTYVRLLHEAALTGQLPIYSVNGRPTGQFQPLNAEQRMEVMKFMINKVVPDPPREIHTTATTPEQLANDPSNVLAMSTAELLRVVHDTAPEPASVH